jgi:hypothetical protein
MYGFFGPYTVCFGVGYICTLTPSSTLGHVLSIYVASEMTNSNLFQKIQKFPKNPKILKKLKLAKSQNWPKKPILENFGFFKFFFKFLPFLAFFFGFFGKFCISCSLHRGTYRVQKSDVDDSVEGTEKAM